MEDFLTWNILKDYVTFVGIVFSVTAFTKDVCFICKIPTRLWSFLIAFSLIITLNIHENTFELLDVIIYAINAVLISASANGISDVNNKK